MKLNGKKRQPHGTDLNWKRKPERPCGNRLWLRQKGKPDFHLWRVARGEITLHAGARISLCGSVYAASESLTACTREGRKHCPTCMSILLSEYRLLANAEAKQARRKRVGDE